MGEGAGPRLSEGLALPGGYSRPGPTLRAAWATGHGRPQVASLRGFQARRAPHPAPLPVGEGAGPQIGPAHLCALAPWDTEPDSGRASGQPPITSFEEVVKGLWRCLWLGFPRVADVEEGVAFVGEGQVRATHDHTVHGAT